MRSSLRVRDERNEKAPRIESMIPTAAASLPALVLFDRPFEVGVRDRVAVRVVCREAERAVDARLELLRDHVLEAVSLVVHRVDMQAECLGEVELQQPVMANHFEGD